MRVGELPDQPRLADAGLADHRHDLAVPLARLLQRRAQRARSPRRDRRSASAPRGGGLQPRVRTGPAPVSSKISIGVRQPLDRHGPERLHLDEALGEGSVSGVSRIVPGSAICSMRAARCVVCPTAV